MLVLCTAEQGGVWLTLPSPRPLMTFPRVSKRCLLSVSKTYPQTLTPTQQLNLCVVHSSTWGGRGEGLTLPSPRPLITFPRVRRLLLMALPSVCLSLMSPSSLAASVLRSLPARSTKFRVETCKKRLRQFDEKQVLEWRPAMEKKP